MSIDYSDNSHAALHGILKSRGMAVFPDKFPLWKFKLNAIEYKELRETLCAHSYELEKYAEEAALCYAEWWRRDYKGNIPSKEDVAAGIGLRAAFASELFDAARAALKKHKYTFIHSQKGTEYFRTLLNQGGLPVTYIRQNDKGFGNFSRFLAGLVRELSVINYDWNNRDNSIIHQFNCISYLGKAFKNDNIYDVAMQIAHAIIMGDSELLPYDAEDEALSELTKSLKREYSRAKRERRTKPLSLYWKLSTADEGQGCLLFNMDAVKDISSDDIPGLDVSTCYSFDIFVAGTLVGKYVRKSINRDDDGTLLNAAYTRISVGMNRDILWRGETVIEIKVRCDNDDRLFLTVPGCYPPNFDYPQLFQMLDENVWSNGQTANSERNIVVFSTEWTAEGAGTMKINGEEYGFREFCSSVTLGNRLTGEILNLTNEFTKYIAEFSGNYISWVEDANYKLMSDVPYIKVYDGEKNRVSQNAVKTSYKLHTDRAGEWKRLRQASVLPLGLVDIKVEYPDGKSVVETFYSIGGLSFSSRNERPSSTELLCSCHSDMRPEIELTDNLNIEYAGENSWRVSRKQGSSVCPSVCSFRIYKQGNPPLRLSVAIPFDGIMITDLDGNVVTDGKTISFANLYRYNIISHGGTNRCIDVSYTSDKTDGSNAVRHLKGRVCNGLIPLSDYHDLIVRMFNLYGANSFDRSSAVVLNVSGREILVRRFVLESTIENGSIRVIDRSADDSSLIEYDGTLYAIPVDEGIDPEELYPVELVRNAEDANLFSVPEECGCKEIIVFSGAETARRIVPKYFNLNEIDFDESTRLANSFERVEVWTARLTEEDVFMGTAWRKVCKAFEICSRHDLPFRTYDGLRAACRRPELLAKFVIAMWLNGCGDVLIQDVEGFEQEMVTAIHWIPAGVWKNEIKNMEAAAPDSVKCFLFAKLEHLLELLSDILRTTLSIDVADEFKMYISAGEIGQGTPFYPYQINKYKTKIHGLTDTNSDLPIIRHSLRGRYYNNESMPVSYRVMLESAMCAAENTACVDGCTSLFSHEKRENARIVNFYRRYFKETYSDVFFKTLKYIVNPNKNR
ncbi:MAG: hypothetical protein IKJ95_07855 [Bacteroidaceae bacterium]|nr:hypothetical protein [Bacteroidaceae bacterium]